jgi:hypothetical protein
MEQKMEQTIAEAISLDNQLRRILTAVIRRCRMSRPQICEEMSLRSGVRISKGMLDHWTSHSHCDARFPAFLIPIFCEVTGDDALQRWLMGATLRGLLKVGESLTEVRDLVSGRKDRKALKV